MTLAILLAPGIVRGLYSPHINDRIANLHLGGVNLQAGVLCGSTRRYRLCIGFVLLVQRRLDLGVCSSGWNRFSHIVSHGLVGGVGCFLRVFDLERCDLRVNRIDQHRDFHGVGFRRQDGGVAVLLGLLRPDRVSGAANFCGPSGGCHGFLQGLCLECRLDLRVGCGSRCGGIWQRCAGYWPCGCGLFLRSLRFCLLGLIGRSATLISFL